MQVTTALSARSRAEWQLNNALHLSVRVPWSEVTTSDEADLRCWLSRKVGLALKILLHGGSDEFLGC